MVKTKGWRKQLSMVAGTTTRAWRVVAQGQACSALTALTGATATLLAARGVTGVPTAMSAPMYALLAGLLWWPSRKAGPGVSPSEASPRGGGCGSPRGGPGVFCAGAWRREAVLWLSLALVDVEANACVVLAYQYTTLTSVMLLDCFTIPCVMVLSRTFLRARYGRAHVLGAALCAVGVATTVLSDTAPHRFGGPRRRRSDTDTDGDDAPSPRRRLLGDGLALTGAALYAVSNVAQEAFVKERGAVALLGRLGFAGALVSSLQAAALERGALRNAAAAFARGPRAALLLAAYVLSLTAMYAGTSLFFLAADAAAFNLSLLTSDAYALLFAGLVNGRLPPPLYFLALAITASGVVVYHTTPSPTSGAARLGRARAASFAADAAQTPTTRSPLLLAADPALNAAS